jgi:hypothetical protein
MMIMVRDHFLLRGKRIIQKISGYNQMIYFCLRYSQILDISYWLPVMLSYVLLFSIHFAALLIIVCELKCPWCSI